MLRTGTLLLLGAALLPRLWAAPAPGFTEPPLPGTEGPVTADEAFSILPGQGEIPPESISPGTEDLIEPPPESPELDRLPEIEPSDVEPLGMPSDGEPMPEMPHIPG